MLVLQLKYQVQAQEVVMVLQYQAQLVNQALLHLQLAVKRLQTINMYT